MDYSKMSDQEINMAVAAIIHPERMVIESKSRPPCACITGQLPSYWVDYCNAPADAWSIIADKKICLAFDVFAEPQDGGGWVASPAYGWETERVRHDNPLRAAMILFLKMQESANVPANSTGSDIR